MSVQVIGCLSATVLYLCFFFTASKLQFRHRVEGLRTHRFWLARARLVVAFGLFGSVASSFGTMWKGCERTVFGCLFSGLCFACLGHEACCRSRLSEASHRGILLGVGSNPAAVRTFRMGSFTAPWHVCGRFGLGTTFGSSTAFGVAVYWFRTQPRSEGAGHKKCFMDSKGDGKHFFWLVFLACLSSALVVFGLFGSVAHELHFCVCAGYRLLICYGPLPVFFFTASKLQFRHRVEGLRTHRFWLARARLVVAFGLFGSVASSFGTMWKGCERTVFGCLFSGLCFACLGHEACCRSRLSEASHRGILLGVGSNPAAVRAFRMGSFTAPWHVCGRFGLGTTFGSSTAFGVAVYWFGTQPRSERAGHKKCFMDSKGDGKHFFWLVFLACLSSACSGVWPFRIRCPRASFLCLCRL